MKIACASDGTLTESKAYIKWALLHEHETAPTWSFDYGKYRTDPSPKILVLGSYAHPRTGNNLIGGINLNYLSPRQKLLLRKNLPKIMTADNLYNRYHIGLDLMPDIFNEFYRTYNPSYIKAVTQDVIVPEVPPDQASKDLMRHKIDQYKKKKDQRQQEYMPKYSKDISNMQKELDKKTDEILRAKPEELPVQDAEEQQAAIVNKARQEYQKQHPEQVAVPDLERMVDRQRDQEGYIAPEPEELNQTELAADINDEEESTEKELERASNDEDPLGMEESITYYDPYQRRYIIEPAYKYVSHWRPKFGGRS